MTNVERALNIRATTTITATTNTITTIVARETRHVRIYPRRFRAPSEEEEEMDAAVPSVASFRPKNVRARCSCRPPRNVNHEVEGARRRGGTERERPRDISCFGPNNGTFLRAISIARSHGGRTIFIRPAASRSSCNDEFLRCLLACSINPGSFRILRNKRGSLSARLRVLSIGEFNRGRREIERVRA